jgi:hypothetical protein
MRFVCRWLAQGIEEVSTELDAQVIPDAAALAVPIWPEDIELPEDEDPPETLKNVWSSQSYGATAPE